ncbi:hypothetical protein RHGRI_037259 [Rhododendron griersonianum]|uniref:Uncharacterized protein n=1 Tax=Rhododendron griersonianum TaxID=479676 RepID=A0AAV6HR21_9ERIC|nr:hypothetical protein RHGRI_037259 [Rhododendron griersonianum]
MFQVFCRLSGNSNFRLIQYRVLVESSSVCLVREAVHGLRESAASRTSRLQQEMSTMQDSGSAVKAEWKGYTEKAETHYLEDTAAVESGKKDMEEVL